MTDYTKNSNFAAKNGQQIIGSDFDSEFDEIQTAVASKEDKINKGAANGYASLDAGSLVPVAQLPSATDAAKGAVELATSAEAVAGADTTRAVTAAGVKAVLEQAGGMAWDITQIADPNVDAILFWDDSLGAITNLTVGSQLAISGTTLSCTVDLTNLSATNLTSGSIPNARVPASAVTQHQASLTIAESQITDSTILARNAAAETISGSWTVSGGWTISGSLTRSGQGRYPYLNGSTNTGGAITLSTSAATGTPANGDIWLQHAV